MPRFRYLGWPEYGRLLERLAREVASGGAKFDLVVGIARGGLPVAMVVSDRLGTKVDFVNVKSYTGIGERTRPKILSTITEEIEKKRVLVVDDIIDGGETMETVTKYLQSLSPASTKTAALFTKPWSSVRADYSLGVVDSWVVFPYERGEVKRLRAEQRRG